VRGETLLELFDDKLSRREEAGGEVVGLLLTQRAADLPRLDNGAITMHHLARVHDVVADLVRSRKTLRGIRKPRRDRDDPARSVDHAGCLEAIPTGSEATEFFPVFALDAEGTSSETRARRNGFATTLWHATAPSIRYVLRQPDLGLDRAAPGTFMLTPPPAMRQALGADYTAMAGMILGTIPALDDVLASVADVEQLINLT
jgi:hypothetical protein